MISRKTEDVAALPLRMNLQLFAEEVPNLEDSEEFKEDLKEFEDESTESTESETENETVETEEAETPEVAAPEPKRQDSETNKAFQEMRKQLEAERKQREETEARAKRADDLIAEQYGHQGIFTVEQYQAALKREREAENQSRYKEAGLTPEEIEAIQNYSSLKAEREQQQVKETQAQQEAKWKTLYASYPDLIKDLDPETGAAPWYTAEMHQLVSEGNSPLLAYEYLNSKNKIQEAQAAAKQEALNKMNSKKHIKPNGTDNSDIDHVEIDPDTMRMYRALTGKTDEQIRAWHKKNAK